MTVAPSPELVGCADPRLGTEPRSPLTRETSLGFEVADFARDILGEPLLPWQEQAAVRALELNPDGTFRFRTVLILVARQAGKSHLLRTVALWRLFVDQAALILSVAQSLDIAREAWRAGCIAVEAIPELKAELGRISRVNGDEFLALTSGARWKIGAANRSAGRGLSVDMLVMDELREQRSWDAWSALSKTTNARARGQTWCISNAGDDQSVVLNHLRASALAGDDESLCLLEWSAPDGCALDDPAAWAQANPSLGLPHGTSVAAIQSALATDPEEVFRTEVLCQRVQTLTPLPITPVEWAPLKVHHRRPPAGVPTFGVSVSPSLKSAAITAAVEVGNVVHVELADHRQGTDWLVARCKELQARNPESRFVTVSTGAVASLLPDLVRADVEPTQKTLTDLARSYGHLEKRVKDRTLSHSGAQGFEDALAGAVKRDVGEGLWSLAWRKSGADLAPIESAALAVWVHSNDDGGFWGSF